MINSILRKQQIIKIKQELIEKYICLMFIILLFYASIFFFFIKDSFLVYYLLGGAGFLIYSWFIIRNQYSVEKIVSGYFILAPIYNIYLMLLFWNVSVASLVWLIPLPLGAYIFLSKKEIYIYSAYAIFIIFIVVVMASVFNFEFVQHTREQIRITDTFLILSNFLIVTLLVYYKDKIRKLEIISEIEEKEKIVLPVTLDEKDAQYSASLFKRIEKAIEKDELFKNPKLNISTLSTILEVNNNYISKAIRYKGFPNFNSYINSHRIIYVKQLIEENDLDKVTLMYIYTEAGFLNQSTFNRTFKQIEEITPSEYIQKVKNKAKSSALS